MDESQETLAAPLLEWTIGNLRELLRRLENDQAELNRQVTELRTNIHRLEAQRRNSAPGLPHDRQRKGENLQRIRQALAADPDIGLSMQQIAEKTGLPVSSVHAVLKRPGCGLRKDDFSGLYRLDPAENVEPPPEASLPG